MQVTPDMILVDGQVLTMDEADTVAQAVAVCEGKIIAVGESRAIAQMGGRQTGRIDLAGRTLLPGFIDAHTHNDMYGMMTSDLVVDCHIPPLQSVDDILKAIAARAASRSPPTMRETARLEWYSEVPASGPAAAAAPSSPSI